MKNFVFLILMAFFFPAPSLASDFSNCLAGAVQDAIRQGAPSQAALAAIADIKGPDDDIIQASKQQPEYRMQIYDYLAAMVDDERVRDGLIAVQGQKEFLNDLQKRTGIDGLTLAGIWGIETNFGKILGKHNVIDALATLGCTDWRRRNYFHSELIAAIKIEATGNVNHNHFVGSWAGAFGQTQFMPSTFWRLARDGNNDGIMNIIDEPKDALASSANFLGRAGYKAGEIWGFEVKGPKNYGSVEGRTAKKPLFYWVKSGFMLADGQPLPQNDSLYGLIYPAGHDGPAFLVGRNFDAVYAYNPSIAYALAVNLLADRLRGGAGIITHWPVSDLPLDRNGRRQIQVLLRKSGYDIGDSDGIIGLKANQAIEDIFKKNGQTFNGRPSMGNLELIKKWVK